MAKREFLMLAHNYEPKKHGIGGWFVSEKLDGMRAFWDGGVTRDTLKEDVPWANTSKDARYIKKQVCTGLWTRYGHIIHAPDWFLDRLPKIPLDGELYMPGQRQVLMSIVKDHDAGIGWAGVKYHCFDMPCPSVIMAQGVINTTNYKKTIDQDACAQFLARRANFEYYPQKNTMFSDTYLLLQKFLQVDRNFVALPHPQERLPFATDAANEKITDLLEKICDAGGEGLILRHPASRYATERSHNLLKIKKILDDDGIVTGYTCGRETDKGSKLLGLMGALILTLKNGKRLELSGFTDDERSLSPCDSEHTHDQVIKWAEKHPGQEVPEWIESKYFKRGTICTFRYRDVTADGIPQEARYWRKTLLM